MCMLLSYLQVLFRATNGFHLGGNGLHHDPEPFKRVHLRRMEGDQFKMICRRFCSLQDKDVSIVFLGLINLRLSFMSRKVPFGSGTGFKANG